MTVELGVEIAPHINIWLKFRLKESLVVCVFIAIDFPAESVNQPTRIGVHHKTRFFGCVENDVVGSFFANSVDIQ